jgi:hypothetical protein
MIGDDLTPFFSTAEFAKVATFTFPGTPSTTRAVKGIFDNGYFDREAGHTVIDTTKPQFTCPTAETEGVRRGGIVVIDDKTYSILVVEPDGTGVSIIRLHHEDDGAVEYADDE